MKRENKALLVLWIGTLIIAFQMGINTARVNVISRIYDDYREKQEKEWYGVSHREPSGDDLDLGGYENATSTMDDIQRISSIMPDVVNDDDDNVGNGNGNNNDHEGSDITLEKPRINIGLCPDILTNLGAQTFSTSYIWDQLKTQILNATYYYPANLAQQLEPTNMMQPYQNWINDLFTFYTADRLRRSIGNPAPPKHVVRLIRKIQEIQNHNSRLGVTGDGQKKTIRILVLGGSVTAGHECHLPEFLGLNQKRERSIDDIAHKDCAWAGRLEHLLNHVLFEGDEVVTVDNIASGGQTSEWGALVLEHRLFHEPETLPDIVISAFSANEAFDANRGERVLYDLMQDLIAAANSFHSCDDHAPLIIIADDFYGDSPYKALRQTGYVLMSSTWYNIMAVNYASVVKYKVFAEHFNFSGNHPLTSSKFSTHLGLASHLGMAWTMLFNIINAYVDVCNDLNIGIEHNEQEKYIPPPYWGEAFVRSENEKHDGSVAETEFIGDKDLLPTLQRGEPPTKHFGRIGRGRPDSANVVGEHLAGNIARNNAYCNSLNATELNTPTEGCAYAWISHQLPSPDFVNKQQLAEEMAKVLIANNGWIADGDPIVNPRTGWYTNEQNSTFSLKIQNLTIDTNFVIVYSMKSYGPNFIGSRLAIATEVQRGSGGDDNISTLSDNTEVETFEIDGYHDTRSSVHFPHKFPISGNGAKVGDNLILHAKLVGGSHFKIAGLAFCA